MSIELSGNVCRPDGYNSLEKLISWARLGWTSVVEFLFMGLCVVAASSGIAGLNNVLYIPFMNSLGESYDEYTTETARFNTELAPVLAIPLLVLSGLAVRRWGRFCSLIGCIVLSMPLLLLIWKAPSRAAVIAGWTVSVFWLFPSIMAIALIFCYETCPIKFRVPAIIGMTLLETLGTLVIALGNIVSLNSVSVEKTDEEDAYAQALSSAKDEARFNYYLISIIVTLGAALGAGLLVFVFSGGKNNSSDTCMSLVCRGKVEQAFEKLLERGSNNETAEPLPMSREEFIHNANNENDAAPDFVKTLFRAKLPLGVVFLASLAYVISDISILTNYYYPFEDFLGGGPQENLVPGMLVRHLAASVGLLVSLGVWLWMKDIRFMPSVGAFLAAIGALICSTVKVLGEDGLPVSGVESPSTLVAGVVFISLGISVLSATVRILLMDIFSNKARGQGLFLFKCLDSLSYSICCVFCYYWKSKPWFFVGNAALIALIGAAILAAFYMTSWFDHSLMCRDPETDACWLVAPGDRPHLSLKRSLLYSRN